MSSTIVAPCTCTGIASIPAKCAGNKVKQHLTAIPFHLRDAGVIYQEARYGKGRRLHNICPPKSKQDRGGLRCTICCTRKEL